MDFEMWDCSWLYLVVVPGVNYARKQYAAMMRGGLLDRYLLIWRMLARCFGIWDSKCRIITDYSWMRESYRLGIWIEITYIEKFEFDTQNWIPKFTQDKDLFSYRFEDRVKTYTKPVKIRFDTEDLLETYRFNARIEKKL